MTLPFWVLKVALFFGMALILCAVLLSIADVIARRLERRALDRLWEDE